MLKHTSQKHKPVSYKLFIRKLAAYWYCMLPVNPRVPDLLTSIVRDFYFFCLKQHKIRFNHFYFFCLKQHKIRPNHQNWSSNTSFGSWITSREACVLSLSFILKPWWFADSTSTWILLSNKHTKRKISLVHFCFSINNKRIIGFFYYLLVFRIRLQN